MMKKTICTLLLAFISILWVPEAEAGPRYKGGGGGAVRGGGERYKARPDYSRRDSRANDVRGASINNVNINRNVNVNRREDVNVRDERRYEDRRDRYDHYDRHCCRDRWDDDYHPLATAAAVAATVAVTSAVVGSIVNAPPPGCTRVNYGGMIYQQCGDVWYQPQGRQYVVISPPY